MSHSFGKANLAMPVNSTHLVKNIAMVTAGSQSSSSPCSFSTHLCPLTYQEIPSSCRSLRSHLLKTLSLYISSSLLCRNNSILLYSVSDDTWGRLPRQPGNLAIAFLHSCPYRHHRQHTCCCPSAFPSSPYILIPV